MSTDPRIPLMSFTLIASIGSPPMAGKTSFSM
nr:MAG TPA: Dephospho-CoA kinase [Caudoviricetes sp.]